MFDAGTVLEGQDDRLEKGQSLGSNHDDRWQHSLTV